MIWVLLFVAACGHHEPVARASTPVAVTADAVVADAAVDGAIDAAVDAPSIVAVVDAAPADAAPPAPPSSAYPIVAVSVDGGGSILTIAGGSDRGIQQDWNATLVDPKKPGRGPTVSIVRIDKRSTIVRSTLSPDEIRLRFTHVRVVP